MQRIVAAGRPLTDANISGCPGAYISSENRHRYIDRNEAEQFLSEVLPVFRQGGSAANTACECSSMGLPVMYVGSVGNDERGQYISRSLQQAGASPALKIVENEITGFTVVINTDMGRYGLYHYGASDFPDVSSMHKNGADIFYAESYLFSSPRTSEIIDIYRKHEQTTALTLSGIAGSAQEQATTLIKELIERGWCDILFGNEIEFARFFGDDDVNTCVAKASEKIKVGAITLGNRGSVVFSPSARHDISPYAYLEKGVLGDGDAYAGGFLFGFAKGYSLLECGMLGSVAAHRKISRGIS